MWQKLVEVLKGVWSKYNPFDIDKYIHEIAKPMREFRIALEEIRHENNVTIALLENALAEKEFILQQFVDVIPDMVWLKKYNEKGEGGEYVYANCAIREKLLLCANPIGRTDAELALRAKRTYGEHNHTFGEKCANSDLLTIENWKNGYRSSQFLESGLVKGEMIYLEVNKAVVTSGDDRVIGVCGAGRVVTEYLEAVKKLESADCGACSIEVKKLIETFKKYEFGEE